LASVTLKADESVRLSPLRKVGRHVGDAISLGIRIEALVKRAAIAPLLLPSGEVEAGDELVRETLARAVELGYLVIDTDPAVSRIRYSETAEGHAKADSFLYYEIVSFGEDDSLNGACYTLRVSLWDILLSGGVTDIDEAGVGSVWGEDLQVAHLLTCGVVTGAFLPLPTMREHLSGDRYKDINGVSASASCSCGKVRGVPLHREMSRDEVAHMLDIVTRF